MRHLLGLAHHADPAFAALRREFAESRPGLDCLHCRIRRDPAGDPDDDFFYRKVAKPLPS